MTIHYFLFQVLPEPDSDNFEDSGGAFVNCWVRSASEQEAERIAVDAIRNDGWYIRSLEEHFIAKKERYLDDPEVLELYQQAETEGESYLFNIWPPDPQDDDKIH